MSNQQINVNIDSCKSVKCDCGNETFQPVNFLKRVPALMIGQSTDQFVPVPAYRCTRCGILLDFGKLLKEPSVRAQKRGWFCQ